MIPSLHLFAPQPMHIPDGFLSVAVSLLMWAASVLVIGYALKRVNRELGERQVPLMGVLAAAIFAGQMLNFAVAGGTSGHLMGVALATILLGPWPAVIVMTVVVGVQALIFQDGGLLALGANLFNMGIVGVTVSYFVYRSLRRVFGQARWGVLAAGGAAAWASIFIAALAVALQLALSGTSPANLAIPAMAGIHAVIGLGEALITVGALALIKATRGDLLAEETAGAGSSTALWVGGLVIALGLAVASPLASAHPDGLEWVAEQKGFLGLAQGPAYQLAPDYLVPGIANTTLATILAGVLGVLIVLGVSVGLAYARRRKPVTNE
ncbi:MAG: energy-coupling factor ABC transporter permease [Chloroflexota bacterium]